ncbi:MAG: DUF87 domain-containing protein [Anaerolineales bacterium]|nr:DUF87 domain-containing protein [Anaerolineales bacterium]
MDTKGKFYLGRIFDPQTGKVSDQPLLYDPADLTTHGVVVGMTGSGKTGLCIDLLEEAALLGIPALLIDPKGDITNALLHFPDLAPQDFQPWVNADLARREGKTIEQAAQETAALWKKGLAEWGIQPERLQALKNAAHFAVYTPGSDAGIPVSILASLKTPAIPWEGNREILREKISGTVTALLGLVGMQDIDPVRSREHILLSNIFENSWSQGKDLDLGELILQTQTPPFAKLGVFDVNAFYPEKERFELAMLLNNILAAPAFQTWIEGQPLDIPSLLYGPDGRPRHCVFYLAHLTDSERMFIVTLLYAAVETWMRSQTGTNALRAIIYFDEIYGYAPPISNPPSKSLMLRMLKQARAFGVGQVLVTQNPVDIDYKGLSNAGSWFIGKLQTEQDKTRLLDGLESAMAGGLDRAAYDRMISALGKRVFLLHNVHAKGPQLFQTRWAMNYLAGPLTRTQIPELNQLVGAAISPPAPSAPAPAAAAQPPLGQIQPVPVAAAEVDTRPVARPQPSAPTPQTLETRPAIPSGIVEYFLPNNLTFTQAFKAAGRAYPPEAFSQGLVYRPVIIGQASVRFLNRKYNLDCEIQKTVLVKDPDRRGIVRWENYPSQPIPAQQLDESPDPQARFTPLEAPFTDGKALAAMDKDFLDWVYRTTQATVRANETIGVYAGPDVSPAEFRTMTAEAAREQRDAEIKKISATFDKQIATLQTKLGREERELAEDQSELSQRKMEEVGTHAENVLSLFSGRRSSRRLSTSLSKRRMTEQAKADVEESIDAIADLKRQLAALEKERAKALEEVNMRWGDSAIEVREIPIAAMKKDILLDFFGVAWMPFHIAKIGETVEELPGFATQAA